jgi:ubiquinone/menaquinone biosynthesis C-methylase UbiE
MSLERRVERRKTERMPDSSFRIMTLMYRVVDSLYPHIGRRVKRFGIEKGATVVDYGCGPGRYAIRFADLVGEEGKVYAVDIHPLAIEAVSKKIAERKLTNIEPMLADGYESTLPDGVADVVCAIDIFWAIRNPTEFLGELRRITKNEGTLIVDFWPRPRRCTKQKLLDSGCWDIVEETSGHLKCKPR